MDLLIDCSITVNRNGKFLPNSVNCDLVHYFELRRHMNNAFSS